MQKFVDRSFQVMSCQNSFFFFNRHWQCDENSPIPEVLGWILKPKELDSANLLEMSMIFLQLHSHFLLTFCNEFYCCNLLFSVFSNIM